MREFTTPTGTRFTTIGDLPTAAVTITPGAARGEEESLTLPLADVLAFVAQLAGEAGYWLWRCRECGAEFYGGGPGIHNPDCSRWTAEGDTGTVEQDEQGRYFGCDQVPPSRAERLQAEADLHCRLSAAHLALGRAEGREQALRWQLEKAADHLDWAAEGMHLPAKGRLRACCDESRKMLREGRELAGGPTTALQAKPAAGTVGRVHFWDRQLTDAERQARYEERGECDCKVCTAARESRG
jgi:hypothetical protein